MGCVNPTSSIGCANMTFVDFYVCFVCYYKQKILEQKKLQKKLYPNKTGKSIVLQKFTHPGAY